MWKRSGLMSRARARISLEITPVTSPAQKLHPGAWQIHGAPAQQLRPGPAEDQGALGVALVALVVAKDPEHAQARLHGPQQGGLRLKGLGVVVDDVAHQEHEVRGLGLHQPHQGREPRVQGQRAQMQVA